MTACSCLDWFRLCMRLAADLDLDGDQDAVLTTLTMLYVIENNPVNGAANYTIGASFPLVENATSAVVFDAESGMHVCSLIGSHTECL